MNYTSEQLDEIFNKLPEKIQEFILSDDVAEALDQIIEEDEIAEAEIFRRIVFLLLIGEFTINDFRNHLVADVHIPSDDIDMIVNELDDILTIVWGMLDEEIEKAPKSGSSQQMQSPSGATIASPQEKTVPTKQEVMNDIEQPVPLIPKLQAQAQVPTPKPQPIIPIQPLQPIVKPQQQAPLAPLPQPSSTAISPGAHPSILDARLNKPTNLPREETIIDTESQKTYTDKDPYREPPTA